MTQAWNADIRSDGMASVTNAVGHNLFDVAFRSDIGEELRLKLLHQITEAPAMFVLLAALGQQFVALKKGFVEAVGEAQARKSAPWLFEFSEAIAEQIARATAGHPG